MCLTASFGIVNCVDRACFEGQKWGEFRDIDHVTMFADYRVPQALLALDLLTYSDELMQYLQKDGRLEPGEEREVEIRGCSIWSVELLRKEIARLVPSEKAPTAIVLDFFLWDYAKESDLSAFPIHKTRSVFY